ncbi:MAG TPA: TetR/AcrR family transcriptional regulator [Galbitalea sp.]|jgi:AcrR family transcriptional regulator
MQPAAPTTPPRGTRPSNRRDITVQAAVELFARNGYAQVGMSDIAAATNVGASALYRHFSSKTELLVAAVRSGLGPWGDAIGEPGGSNAAEHLELMLHRLSITGIDHRRVGVLWQREVRNLPADDQHELRDELRSAAGRVADAVRAARPELDDAEADTLAWCALGALVSIGFHNLELPRPEFDDLLFDIMLRIVSTELPDAVRSSASAEQIASDSLPRRDQLITVATQLFADRGFAATGIDDIGDAAGIAGPSVYNHFASKQAILAAAIDRAERILNGELETVLSSASTSEHKIGELVGSYVRRANTDRFVLRTLLSELGELAPADRQLARQAQRRYIDSWVDLLQKFGSEDPVTARIRVQAVLLLVNDAVQTPHLRSQAGFEETLVVVAENVLGAAGSV